jgi:Fe-S-cluster containining protein
MTDFKCSQCGVCCKQAGKIGLPTKEDGSCKFLSDDNQCTIYDTRPDICNIKTMYNKRKANGMDISYKEYLKMSSQACNDMMDTYNIDKKYRLNPEDY